MNRDAPDGPAPTPMPPGRSSGTQENPPPETTEVQVREPWRFRILAVGLLFLTALIIARLVGYQIFSSGASVWDRDLPVDREPRGSVVDRNGELLAFDRFFTELSADPSVLSSETARLIATELEQAIGLEQATVYQRLTEYPEAQYALIAKDMDQTIGQYVLARRDEIDIYNGSVAPAQQVENPYNLINVRFKPKRFYPQHELACHVLGLVGVDLTDDVRQRGYYGTEGYFNSYLWQNGVNLQGRGFVPVTDLPAEQRRFLPSVAGRDLVLTIDRTVQWIAEEELARGLKKHEAESGSIIVMDPKTGAILAMASAPNFDPNSYGDAEPETFNNPVVSAQYEPGSIYKIITMAGALDAEILEPSTVYTDTGRISLGQRVFFNSNRSAVGVTTAADALARSLNVVTVQVANDLGADLFYEYVRRFGFGEPTEVDLSGEVAGAVKQPHMRTWSLSDLGANSFGQGLAVTPLQMISAAAAIANEGKLMRPYVVQARIQDDQALVTEPTLRRQAISPEAAAALTEMMVGVVETGAPAARVEGYTIAGKTGTAQIPVEGGYAEDETIASFVGFAPADDPQFVVLVKLDRPNPEISQWASATAAPVFASVTERLFDHYNIPPDEIRLGAIANQTE